jgi:hypothetical protein
MAAPNYAAKKVTDAATIRYATQTILRAAFPPGMLEDARMGATRIRFVAKIAVR